MYELPGLHTFGRKICKAVSGRRTHFRFDGHVFQEVVEDVSVQIHNLPFERGAMRQVHLMRDLGEPEVIQVCKIGRWIEEPYSRKEAERDAKSLAIASFLAAEFRKLCNLSPESFRFVDTHLYECTSQDSWGHATNHVFVGEPHLSTRFIKFNGNDGFVNHLDHSLEAQAFLHFTFVACGEALMVSDIQGARQGTGLLLTDPQILSHWGGFGPGDLRKKGMRACMMSHECNYLCHRWGLGLKESGAKHLDGIPKGQTLLDIRQLSRSCPSAHDAEGGGFVGRASSSSELVQKSKVAKGSRTGRQSMGPSRPARLLRFTELATESDESD